MKIAHIFKIFCLFFFFSNTVFAAPPTLSSVTPFFGPKAGATEVTVKGTNFTTGASVQFGTTAGTNVQIIDSETLTVESPPGVIGNVDVTVTTSDGTSTSSSPFSTFTYQGGWLAYVTNADDDTVTVIDVATDSPILQPIAVGNQPFGVAFTPDGKKAYVVNFKTSNVSVVDVASSSVNKNISSVNYAYLVAISPNGEKAYITNVFGNNKVSVIDVANDHVAGTISVGDNPRGVAFTPDGNKAYVTNFIDDTMSVIDVTNDHVVDTISVGDQPVGVAFTPDGNKDVILQHTYNYNFKLHLHNE